MLAVRCLGLETWCLVKNASLTADAVSFSLYRRLAAWFISVAYHQSFVP